MPRQGPFQLGDVPGPEPGPGRQRPARADAGRIGRPRREALAEPGPRASSPGTWCGWRPGRCRHRARWHTPGPGTCPRTARCPAGPAARPARPPSAPRGAVPAARAVLCRGRDGIIAGGAGRLARDFPSNSHALFTEVSGSSSVTAMSITCAASCLSPRSRRAVPRARALPTTSSAASSCQFRSEFSRSPAAAARSPPPPCCVPATRRPMPSASCSSRPRVLSASRRYEGVKPFPAQQRAALAPGLQFVVLAQDPRLVRRGEGPPLRSPARGPFPGGHGTIMPRSGRRHVGHRHSHV